MSTLLARSAASVLNHLLSGAPWAQGALQAHAGKVARFSLSGVDTSILVEANGMVAGAPSEASPDVTIQIPILDALRVAAGDPDARSSAVVEGDSRFATDIWRLSAELKWDAEEDISRFVGDIAAHRLVSSTRALTSWARDSVMRVESASAEYATEEAELLPPRAQVDHWMADVDRLRDDVERLEQRIARIESGPQ